MLCTWIQKSSWSLETIYSEGYVSELVPQNHTCREHVRNRAPEQRTSFLTGSVLADLLIAAAELLFCLRWLGKQGWHCAAQHLKLLTAQMSCIVQNQFNSLTVTNLTLTFRNILRKLTLMNWGSCRYIALYIYIYHW